MRVKATSGWLMLVMLLALVLAVVTMPKGALADDEVAGVVDEDLSAQASTQWSRLAGDSALDTMAAIGKAGFANDSCNVAVLATAGTYHDALTASALAGLEGCPVLLTSESARSAVSPQTAAELKRLSVKKVYICGGTYWIPDAVAKSLRTAGYQVERLAGANASETALKLYQSGGKKWGKTAVVATDQTYHDALAAGPFAYACHAPIFLTSAKGAGESTRLSSSTSKAIVNGGFNRVVLCGGTWFLDAAVEKQLTNAGFKGKVVRLAGTNACETSAKVAEFCLGEGMSAKNVGVATAEGYWDALSGAALCGKKKAPLLLANNATMGGSRDLASAINFLKKRSGDVSRGYLFGGTYFLPESAKRALEELNPSVLDDAAFEGIARRFMMAWHNDWDFKNGEMIFSQKSMMDRCLPFIATGTSLYAEFSDPDSYDPRYSGTLFKGAAEHVLEMSCKTVGYGRVWIDVRSVFTQNNVNQKFYDEMVKYRSQWNGCLVTFNNSGKVIACSSDKAKSPGYVDGYKRAVTLSGTVVRENYTPSETLMVWGAVRLFLQFDEPIWLRSGAGGDVVVERVTRVELGGTEMNPATEKADDIYYAQHPSEVVLTGPYASYVGKRVTVKADHVWREYNAHYFGPHLFNSEIVG